MLFGRKNSFVLSDRLLNWDESPWGKKAWEKTKEAMNERGPRAGVLSTLFSPSELRAFFQRQRRIC